MSGLYEELDENEIKALDQIRLFVTDEKMKFGDYIIIGEALNLKQLRICAENLNIEVRFVIFRDKTICFAGENSSAPSNHRIREVLKDNKYWEDYIMIDIHNHPGKHFPVPASITATLPSTADLSIGSEAEIMGVMSPYGICFFPKATYTIYNTELVNELLYQYYITSHGGADKPWIVEEERNRLQRARASIMMRLDSIEQQRRLRNKEVAQFLFQWEELGSLKIIDLVDMTKNIWKKDIEPYKN